MLNRKFNRKAQYVLRKSQDVPRQTAGFRQYGSAHCRWHLGYFILQWWWPGSQDHWKLQADRTTVTLERGILSKERIELDIDNIRVGRCTSPSSTHFQRGPDLGIHIGRCPEIEIGGMPLPHRFR